MKKNIFFKIAILSILLTSCTNRFSSNYIGANIDEINSYFGEPNYKLTPKLIDRPLEEANNDTKEMQRHNFIMLGYSEFVSTKENPNDAISFAYLIEAEKILFYHKYAGTVQGSIPLTLPKTTKINTNYYGPSGYGDINTNIYGQSTYYVPYSEKFYHYLVTYWKKNPFTPKFGILFTDLTDEDKKLLKSNKGIKVTIILNDSIAFKNDIMENDIITNINNNEIYNTKDFNKKLDKNIKNKKIILKIFRSGEFITKKIKFD